MNSAEEIARRAKDQRQKGDSLAAEASYIEAAELARSVGSSEMRAHALRHVAELAAERGDGERALQSAEEALSLYQANPDELPLNIANAHRVRALAFSALGREQDSARDWRAARDLYEELGIVAGVAECDRRLNSA